MSKRIQILVVEDDPHIRLGLEDTLESEGYGVVSARTGSEALAIFRQGGFDLIVLDLMMPEMNGYDVCREIRKRDEATPIIMLTAKSEEADKVVGLGLGADDYVTKPFGVRELLARVAAALRRSRLRSEADLATEPLPISFALGPARVDRKLYSVEVGGRTSPLTAREMKLTETFFLHPDEVLSRDFLLNSAWGIDYYGTTRTLDQHIAQLRKKIEPLKNPTVIVTVHGVGYRYRSKAGG